MFVLNPINKELFEFQWKHLFYNIWLTHFDQQTSVSSEAIIETRRHRFGLRGNRYTNVIAELYGYASWSELMVSANDTSKTSNLISEHPLFCHSADKLKALALKSVSHRSKCTLKNSDEILACTFVDTVNTILSLPKAKQELDNYPITSVMDRLMRYSCDSGLSLDFPVGIIGEDKDMVAPDFDSDGEIIYDNTQYYTLIEDGVEVDCEVPVSVSPSFSDLLDAESFFLKKAGLYCQYLSNIDARLVDKTAYKVSNLSGYIYR